LAPIAGLSLALAVLSTLGCVSWALGACRRTKKLVALRPADVDRSELDLELRATARELASAALQIRGAARVALASGTATALIALSDALSSGLARGLPPAAACFVLGSLGAGVVAHFGRLAKAEKSRFRAEWNSRRRRDRRV
jgi:hypothetical protein